jgi:hypothetical protein
MEKISVGHFLCGRPMSAREPAYLPLRTTVTDRWGPPVGAIFPQSPLLRAHVSSPAKFLSSSRPPVECSHHLNVHLPS